MRAAGQEVELENSRHTRQLAALDAELSLLRGKGLLTEELRAQFRNAEADANETHARRLVNIREQQAASEDKLKNSTWQVKLAMASSSTEQIFNTFAGASKKMFKFQKAFALAQAAMALPAAVIEGFKNAGGYPWGLIPAAAMAAQGLPGLPQSKVNHLVVEAQHQV